MNHIFGLFNVRVESEELQQYFNGIGDKINPEIDIINEKNFFKREKDDGDRFLSKPHKSSSNENKIRKIQNLADLTKIKRPIESLTDEINVVWPYIGNWFFLFIENDEIKIKTLEDFVYVREFETNFGMMMTVDRGEWGGTLYNLTDKGLEKAGSGNFTHAFEYNNKVYAIATLAHMSLRKCSFHEIKKI